MGWGEILLRTALQIALVAGWLILFIRGNGGINRAGPILYIPFFFGLPALVVTILVLAPVEGVLRDRFGLAAYPMMVAAGAGVPMLILAAANGFRTAFSRGARGIWVVFGGWALLWAATRPLYTWIVG